MKARGFAPNPTYFFGIAQKSKQKRLWNDDASLLRWALGLSLRNSPTLRAGSNSRSLLTPRCPSAFNAHHRMFQSVTVQF